MHAFTERPLPQNPEEEALYTEAESYFRHPDGNALHALAERVLSDALSPERASQILLPAANAALDAEATRLRELVAAQGGELPCREGCAGCCHHFVLCLPFEAVLIGDYLAQSAERRAAFEKSYAAWDDATRHLRTGFLDWAVRRYTQGIDDGSYSLDDYHVPCLFLEEGSCRIYPVRPYACRSCLSLSPACRTPPEGQKAGRESKDFGACTPHKAARTALVDVLWWKCGQDPAQTRACAMPDLVDSYLRHGFGALLERCAKAF